jgi:hypothetical protein
MIFSSLCGNLFPPSSICRLSVTFPFFSVCPHTVRCPSNSPPSCVCPCICPTVLSQSYSPTFKYASVSYIKMSSIYLTAQFRSAFMRLTSIPTTILSPLQAFLYFSILHPSNILSPAVYSPSISGIFLRYVNLLGQFAPSLYPIVLLLYQLHICTNFLPINAFVYSCATECLHYTVQYCSDALRD